MSLFGFKITLGVIFLALVFYFLGAKKPGLANKVWP